MENYTTIIPYLPHLNNTELALLVYLSSFEDWCQATNEELGNATGKNMRSISRAVANLNDVGLIELEILNKSPYRRLKTKKGLFSPLFAHVTTL